MKAVRLNETARVRTSVSLAIAAAAIFWISGTIAGQTLQKEPRREAGVGVTGAFEGWYKNADGSYSLLFGYYNRNAKQELDIPIGPGNRMEPEGPDRGQPTHFLTGRRWGIFRVKVPADFGKNRITWTLVANGQTTTIPGTLHIDYQISPLVSTASALDTPGEGDTPPVLGSGSRWPDRRAQGDGRDAAHALGVGGRRRPHLHEFGCETEEPERPRRPDEDEIPGPGHRDVCEGPP
jgi:hypothetical protein